MTTGNEALRAAIPRLRDSGIEDAALDARLLLAHALGIAQDRLTLHLPDAISSDGLGAGGYCSKHINPRYN